MLGNGTHWTRALNRWALAPVVAGVVIFIAALSLSERASLHNPESHPSWVGVAWREDASFKCASPSSEKSVASLGSTQPVGPPDTLMSWWRARAQLRIDCKTVSTRRDALKRALSDPSDRLFAQARHLLVEEKAQLAELEQREHSLRFKDFAFWGRVAAGVPGIVFSLFTVVLLIRSVEHDRNRVEWQRWLRVYSLIALLCTSAVFASMYLGGIAPHHKMWVGVDSWWLSRAAWWFSSISLTGLAFAVARPLSLLWLLTERRLIPERVDPTASDGQCAVGEYISFLHTWTIVASWAVLIVIITVVSVMPHEIARFSPAYIPVAVISSITVALVCRMVRNAIIIRTRYRGALRGLGTSWSEVDARKPARDPTIVFIGEDWWKLPALLGGFAFTLWGAVEWSGASEILRALIQ